MAKKKKICDLRSAGPELVDVLNKYELCPSCAIRVLSLVYVHIIRSSHAEGKLNPDDVREIVKTSIDAITATGNACVVTPLETSERKVLK